MNCFKLHTQSYKFNIFAQMQQNECSSNIHEGFIFNGNHNIQTFSPMISISLNYFLAHINRCIQLWFISFISTSCNLSLNQLAALLNTLKRQRKQTSMTAAAPFIWILDCNQSILSPHVLEDVSLWRALI